MSTIQWEDLVKDGQREVVKRLDYNTKANLRRCSKDTKDMVDSVRFVFKRFLFEIGKCDGMDCVTIENGHEKHKFIGNEEQTIVQLHGKAERIENSDYIDAAQRYFNGCLDRQNNKAIAMTIKTNQSDRFPIIRLKSAEDVRIFCSNISSEYVPRLQTLLNSLKNVKNLTFHCNQPIQPFESMKDISAMTLNTPHFLNDNQLLELNAKSLTISSTQMTESGVRQLLKKRMLNGIKCEIWINLTTSGADIANGFQSEQVEHPMIGTRYVIMKLDGCNLKGVMQMMDGGVKIRVVDVNKPNF